jgi:hypothetical protein
MSNKNIIQKDLVNEYLNIKPTKKEKNINRSEHRFNIENDYILISVINRAKKLKQMGFNVSAEGMIKEYCSMYYPDKIDEVLQLI